MGALDKRQKRYFEDRRGSVKSRGQMKPGVRTQTINRKRNRERERRKELCARRWMI